MTTLKTSVANETAADHHYKGWAGFIARYKAKRQARKIIRSLEEAQLIHDGKKAGKSFDQFLEEL